MKRFPQKNQQFQSKPSAQFRGEIIAIGRISHVILLAKAKNGENKSQPKTNPQTAGPIRNRKSFTKTWELAIHELRGLNSSTLQKGNVLPRRPKTPASLIHCFGQRKSKIATKGNGSSHTAN